MEDEGVDQGQDPTSELTFEGAPSASGLPASPSPTTTTLPTPDRAAVTSTSIPPRLWLRAQALLVCLRTPPMYHCVSGGSGLQFCAALVCGRLSPSSTRCRSLCGCSWLCNPEWAEERP